MATAELAVGIMSASLMAGMLAWCVGLVGLSIRCGDTAAAIARQYARGDEAAAKAAQAAGPQGANIHVDRSGNIVRVRVASQQRWGRLGPVTVSGRAEVLREPDFGEAK